MKGLRPHRETETVAVRTCANFQVATTTESEDREVEVLQGPILTSLIYHWILTAGSSTK